MYDGEIALGCNATHNILLAAMDRLAKQLPNSTKRLLDAIFASVRASLAVRTWDGQVWSNVDETPGTVITMNDPEVLSDLAGCNDSAALAELYVSGRVSVDGEFQPVIEVADALIARRRTFWQSAIDSIRTSLRFDRDTSTSRTRRAHLHGTRSCPRRTASAVCFHYDKPLEFWQAWLDPSLTYSCAYFSRGGDSLQHAQFMKLEYICRKLGLQPGMRVFDLGCGWGSFAIHAAQHFGVQVEGVTLSPKQQEFATRRSHELGLANHCTFHVADYRQFSPDREFDCVASIGAIEHVQNDDLSAYFGKVYSVLRPGGKLLNQGITLCSTAPLHTPRNRGFMDAFIFPDTSFTTIENTLAVAGYNGFEARDVECLREHYARTLALWRGALEHNQTAIVAVCGMETFRAFQLYLCGCELGFARGALSLYQSLLVKCDDGASHMPWTRAAWYSCTTRS